MTKKWWKESVIYQIYPRSFMDSNGDGIGDLNGIIQKLDYLKDLGIDVIWLCPIYDSPNADNGYDIRDYRKIMAEFGTMEDFYRLLACAHAKGIRIVMDLVVNHTSDEHEFFQKSKQTPENEYRDYYIWREGKNGKEPNNWGSTFGGSAWKYEKSVGKYYLHLFAEKQPDLNWENEKVRNQIYDMMKWWLDKGIDGFRMDVINCISKDQSFPDGPKLPGSQYASSFPYVANRPRVHEFLQEMNRKVLSHYDIMTVGETGGVTTEEAIKYTAEDRHELNMVFQFEHIDLGMNENGKWNDIPVPIDQFKKIITKWQTELNGRAWNSLFLSNHDQARQVSRFGDDGKYRVESAKLLGTLLHTLQGTPFIYQGEELGMTNVKFDSIEDYRDIETLNVYREFTERNPNSKDEIMRYIHQRSRDNARTPMQWSNSANAGFTSGKPWIKVNPNYTQINVQDELKDKNSVLNYYKKLIRLRKQYEVIIYGDFEVVKDEGPLYCYRRTLDDEKLLVLLNFSADETELTLADNIVPRKMLIGNYTDSSEELPKTLKPYEARVYLLK
jgi:oligo-1,6-glucosidase